MKPRLLLILVFLATMLLPDFSHAQSLQWAKSIGGTSDDYGRGIIVDVEGNVYTTGYFEDTVDFDPGTDIANLTAVGEKDVFISKLDASGDFVWAKAMGGMYTDYGVSLGLDAAGNLYCTGWFSETVDFDPGADTFHLTAVGAKDVFISKLDASGEFIWAKAMGGTNLDYGVSLTVDAAGNVYSTGFFGSTADFDPGIDTFNLTSAGIFDIFVSKLDANGEFVWAKAMGGADNNSGSSIALDETGNVYTIGEFSGTVDFDPGAGTFNLTSAGRLDIFLSKLDSNGEFVWAKAMGGTFFDKGAALALDTSGNVYSTGAFVGTVDFDPGAGTFNLNSEVNGNVFVSKLDGDGNFIWAKALKGTTSSLALDSVGNVYLTGWFSGTGDFDPGPGILNLTSAGSLDMFFAKLDGDGNFVWAIAMGGVKVDGGSAITVDAAGQVYSTGVSESTVSVDSGGNGDIFIYKMSSAIASLEEEANMFPLAVHPNPSPSTFHLRAELAIPSQPAYTVFNQLGQVVWEAREEQAVQMIDQQIDLSPHPDGIYHLRISDGTSTAHRKLLLQR